MQTVKIIALACFIALIASACDSNGVFDQNISTENEVWNRKNIARFEVDITDTTLANNLYVNLRNTTDYPNSNLYLFVTTTAPNGAVIRDTLECILANSYGKWLGKGIGKIKDNQILYKRMVRFPVAGAYTFEVEQAMRVDKLPGIVNVGLRIETVQQ
ncbi:MAG: gliding motility lipoprotein GldH [Bacteroidales bacterium]|nr:gliding motility lipoprotein GldH [Bacteroidales bacterium]MBN2748409.1 gliding motility lipoprotein GldH [Bacteroidales bacterium]